MVTIRRPEPSEAALLTEIAIAAKSYWGYSPAFMAAATAELTITPSDISTHTMRVATFTTTTTTTTTDEIAGVYRLTAFSPSSSDHFDGELSYLWIHPSRIRQGVGSVLWADAMRTARGLGWKTLSLDADPHAEGFYLKKGAEKYGEVGSKSIKGRMLPLIKVDVAKALAVIDQNEETN